MFLYLTFNISCIGFAVMSLLKVYMIGLRHHRLLVELFGILESLFPKTVQDQEKFGTWKYLEKMRLQNLSFKTLMPLLFGFANFSEISITLFKFFFVDGSYDRNFPLFTWFPLGSDGKKSPILFEASYALSVHCAFSIAFISLAIDLLFCSLMSHSNQIIFFKYLTVQENCIPIQ